MLDRPRNLIVFILTYAQTARSPNVKVLRKQWRTFLHDILHRSAGIVG